MRIMHNNNSTSVFKEILREEKGENRVNDITLKKKSE